MVAVTLGVILFVFEMLCIYTQPKKEENEKKEDILIK